ncbi:MAG: hypothetical protein IPJ78_19565 [Gemmatimonadetes bacterium]|nr:hypothetical protein [Gemmatimonadota bacterium]
MHRGPSKLSKLPKLLTIVAALAASSLSCGREVTGPPDGLRRSGPLSFTPLYPAALRAPNGGLHHAVAFEKVRVVFRRSDGGVSLDQTIDFPSDADSVAVRLTVPVSAGAPESGELLALTLYYVDAANDTVFTGGPVQLTVRGAKPGEPPAEPVPVTLTYTGPGRDAVRVTLSPTAAALTAGQTQTFTTQAFDALDNPLQAPVLFESTDTSIVTVTDAGVATARARRGSAFVVAKLYGGAADTSTVSVALPAAAIAASSGSGQTGPAGTLLAQNVIVLVTAADSVPVAGVPVTFAATAGGLPGQTVVNTDAAGFASTTWTLGAAVGAQTMTATAAGLTGSPVTFTATATPGVPTSLAFTVQPPTAVAGQAMTPSVVVEARTSAGGLATGFTDSVTITLGANPGNDSLFGVMTVAAVGGIATFNNLAFDRAATGYSLVASSGALTSASSASFNVVAANANHLGFEVQPAGGTPGVGMLPAPTVRAYDIFDNPAAFSGNVTVALGANPGGATLGGTTTVNAVAGAATFPGLTISAGGIGYTLVATSPGLGGATSDPFTVGTATIAWANPSGGLWSVAANWNLNRVPGPSDVVAIALGGTYAVTLDVSPTIAGIEIGTGAGGTQTLQATSRILTVAGDVIVGPQGAFDFTNASIAGVGTLNNDGLVTLRNGAIALSLDNRATLVASGSSALNGGLSTTPGSTLRVAQVDGCCSTATLAVAGGFTNEGTIELSNQTTSAYAAQLNVTGTLLNSPGGTIASIGGQTPGGARGLAADLDNRGTMLVAVPLLLTGGGATHENSGTIDVSADLTVNQSGASPSFTNTGTLTVATGRTLAVTGGALTLVAPIDGAGNVTVSSATVNITNAFSNATATVTFVNSAVNGPGTFTNAAGRTIVLYSTTINAPFVNAGLAITNGNSAITGAFTNPVGATLRVAQVDGCCSTSTLDIANGFINEGTIELSNQTVNPYAAQLNVVGTLVNAVGATIAALGGQTPGGARGLATDLDNRGTLIVEAPLTLSGAGATHENSGTIDVNETLLISQGGASPSFTNTGTITVAAGRTLTTTAGAFTQAGTLGGAGTVSWFGVTLGLTVPFDNAVTGLAVTNTTINGPASLTNAAGRTLSLFSSTVNAPLVNDGVLIASGNSAITGAFANSASATLRVAQLDGCCSTATLNVANGFTNAGLIELSNQTVNNYGAQLNVVGTLVNAVGATIASLGGQTPGGSRGLATDLDNLGTLTVEAPLILSGDGATHQNSGTVDVSTADLTILQSGASPTFTNTGTVIVGTARTLLLQGGTFVQSSGTLDGTGLLSLFNTTLTLGTPLSNATMQLTAAGSTINGTAALTNAPARTLALYSSTVAAPFVNQGLAIASGPSAITGAFTNPVGATLRVAQLDGCCSTATLTVANGFTNEGLIELSNQTVFNYGSRLNVSTGQLVNAPGATIAAIGGQTPGGGRALGAALENQGTLTVAVPLVIDGGSAQHENTGLIDVGAALQVTQSGTSPVFANLGTITIAAGQTMQVTNGTLRQDLGTIDGTGFLLTLGVTLDLLSDFASAGPSFSLINTTVIGTGTLFGATGRSLFLSNATLNVPFVNEGFTLVSGTSAMNGAVTNSSIPGTMLRIAQADGATSTASLTVANGFTNQGLMELSNATVTNYASQLVVPSGTFVNAPGATLSVLGGQTPGGARTIAAQLDNQGTIITDVPFSLDRAGADHLNTGTLLLNTGNILVTQTGTTPSFTNGGTISVGTGRILAVTNGVFTNDVSGSVAGQGALTFTNVTAAFGGGAPATEFFNATASNLSLVNDASVGTATWEFTNTVVVDDGAILTIPAGSTVSLNASSLLTPVVNAGSLLVSAASAMNDLTTASTSFIRVGSTAGGATTFTQTGGFVNNGLLDLTNLAAGTNLARVLVQNGTLQNAPSGVIQTQAGSAGGARVIETTGGGNFENDGTLTVHAAAAGTLTLTLSGGFITTGTINLEVGGPVAGTDFDRIAVSGNTTLGGTLNVALINAFTPPPASSYLLLAQSAGTSSGGFSTVSAPGFTVPPTYTAAGTTIVAP